MVVLPRYTLECLKQCDTSCITATCMYALCNSCGVSCRSEPILFIMMTAVCTSVSSLNIPGIDWHSMMFGGAADQAYQDADGRGVACQFFSLTDKRLARQCLIHVSDLFMLCSVSCSLLVVHVVMIIVLWAYHGRGKKCLAWSQILISWSPTGVIENC